jgi:tRNA(Ile)-lysidine synthase
LVRFHQSADLASPPTHQLSVSTLAARVSGAVERQRLAPRGARVLVALSGGGDSVALLLVLAELQASGVLTLAGAAHFNHQLRGAESDADEAFCRALAARLDVRFACDRADVAAEARRQKRSLEDAARRLRYAFLDRAADDLGADVIATAHTRDDQAETFLLRILRGAGTRGLSGVRPRRGRVIRPLLDTSRAELRAYLAEAGEAFREDATNADLGRPRNRIRHELLPLLEARYSRGIVPLLAREAALAARDEDFLQQQAIEVASRIVLSDSGQDVRLDAAALAAAHPAIGSRVAAAALARFADGRAVGFDHVDRLLALAVRGSDGAVSLPGQEAIRSGDAIVLRPAAGRRTRENSFGFPLSIPGEVRGEGWTLAAVELPVTLARQRQWTGRALEVGVSSSTIRLPLIVRSRRPGDRFRPLGAPGRRKLQDFLVDRKVPRAERDRLPLVVDAGGRIVWVPGQAVGEEFRVSDPSQGVILLSVRRLGLSGR